MSFDCINYFLCSKVVLAIGRDAMTDDLGLELAHVQRNEKYTLNLFSTPFYTFLSEGIICDEFLQYSLGLSGRGI